MRDIKFLLPLLVLCAVITFGGGGGERGRCDSSTKGRGTTNGTWLSPRFTDNNDGTVTDGLTGLVWMKNPGCFAASNWPDALTYANQLASGQCGLTDGSTAGQWRIPTVNELESLLDISRSKPALASGNPFNNVANSYWSSTSYHASLGARAMVMVIRFTDGRWISGTAGPYNDYRAASLNSLWAVKTGPGGAVKVQSPREYLVYAIGDDALARL
jgi:hypothetical protein